LANVLYNKIMTKPTNTTPSANPQSESSLSILSIVLGLISLTGPGFVLGIPAIITGAISLKRKEGGAGLSITGIVTGAISTIVSILVMALIVFLVIYGINHPSVDSPLPHEEKPLFESSGV